MSPYIVTTKTLGTKDAGWSTCRRTVATLDEARKAVASVAQERGHFNWSEVGYVDAKVRESGGTVGPLPDGTVIEVERA